MSRSQFVGSPRDPRFQPSMADVSLYRVLTKSTTPLSTGQLIEQTGLAASTVRHSVKWWTQQGLLKRVFLDKRAWYSWSPRKSAEARATALSEAAQIAAEHVPPAAAPVGDPLADALRALARLLDATADRLNPKH